MSDKLREALALLDIDPRVADQLVKIRDDVEAAYRSEIERLTKERDEAKVYARIGNEIAVKVNAAVNRAGIHCALYYWEAIDQIAAERDSARAERDAAVGLCSANSRSPCFATTRTACRTTGCACRR